METEQRLEQNGDLNYSLEQQLSRKLEEQGVRAMRMDNLEAIPNGSSQLVVTTTICPLYELGNLRDSRLMTTGTVEKSRVSEKWIQGVRVNQSLQEIIGRSGRNMKVIFTFADLGVIHNSPSESDLAALDYHESQYRLAAERDLGSRGINWELIRYSDISPEFPRFISVGGGESQVDPKEIANQLAQELRDQVSFDSSVINSETGMLNKAGRRIVTSMVQSLGAELTRGLLLQYGTFDAMSTQEQALNVYYERGELLLNMTNLFEHKRRPRLDILCQ